VATPLRPALGFNYPAHTVQVPGDGSNPISYISYKEVAAFTIASIDSSAAENKIVEIGGPQALTLHR